MTSMLRIRAVLAIAALVSASACGSSSPAIPDQSSVAFSTTDLTVGTGTTAAAGKTAFVTESGWLYSDTAVDHKGTQFDPGSSFNFLMGANRVIPGFEQAVTGMQVGGVRRATIPPSLAYGSTGNGPIPPNAALVFEITLSDVQ
jgi:FKBP-type peptidyl-prolyl cis-trans isomerase FkpA